MGSIAIISPSGTRIRYVTNEQVGEDSPTVGEWGQDSDPDWSPDGTQLACTRMIWLCGSGEELACYTAYADGSGVARVGEATSLTGADPAWSPNGKLFVESTYNGLAIFNRAGRSSECSRRVPSPCGSQVDPLDLHRSLRALASVPPARLELAGSPYASVLFSCGGPR